MSRKAWQERIIGERMTMDDRFADRVQASEFSRQQWGLVMTAVEFDVEHADDPERARLVADTSKLPNVVPELDEVEREMSAMAGGGSPGGGGGIVDTVRGALGLGDGGGDDDAEKQAAAEELANQYARGLQTLLEERGRWDEVREAAAAAEE